MKRLTFLSMFLICMAMCGPLMADDPIEVTLAMTPELTGRAPDNLSFALTANAGQVIQLEFTGSDADIQCSNIVYDVLNFIEYGSSAWTPGGDAYQVDETHWRRSFTWTVTAGEYHFVFYAYDLNWFGENDADKRIEITINGKNVIHVKPGGTGDGSSWPDAEDSVDHALTLRASSGDEVWVAGDSDHPYEENITLKSGVGLYGGFEGNDEVRREERDWRENTTIIDGGGSVTAETVVTSPEGAGSDTIVDGFTITNGYGYYAGGVYCTNSSPTIANNTITAVSYTHLTLPTILLV